MIVIQNTTQDARVDESSLSNIMQSVIEGLGNGDSELVIRIVDRDEIRLLNNTYRQKDKTTNILSFENNLPEEIDEKILGDLVICTEVVSDEANEQNKTFNDHMVHISVHGVLHLMGYDHIEEGEASDMESIEINILQKIGISNPYQ
ncbi:MAG TPA: rRNA maturation RNase YbeY [Candidatus Thioglobus sp.]|jgi:probable rRNA maturation factor|nr:rRNA maturation RNase YbeY [Candidatus Thioglobus sp.]HIL43163.1 rRNA maturation RNase YbeY [Gammaproteobacteria bacterium]